MISVGSIQVDETKLAELCRQYKVRELSVFGSAARDEMRLDLDYAGLMLDLSVLLGRKVDLVSKKALKPLIRTSVLRDARSLYGA